LLTVAAVSCRDGDKPGGTTANSTPGCFSSTFETVELSIDAEEAVRKVENTLGAEIPFPRYSFDSASSFAVGRSESSSGEAGAQISFNSPADGGRVLIKYTLSPVCKAFARENEQDLNRQGRAVEVARIVGREVEFSSEMWDARFDHRGLAISITLSWPHEGAPNADESVNQLIAWVDRILAE
jgi:hypothetical protein